MGRRVFQSNGEGMRVLNESLFVLEEGKGGNERGKSKPSAVKTGT